MIWIGSWDLRSKSPTYRKPSLVCCRYPQATFVVCLLQLRPRINVNLMLDASGVCAVGPAGCWELNAKRELTKRVIDQEPTSVNAHLGLLCSAHRRHTLAVVCRWSGAWRKRNKHIKQCVNKHIKQCVYCIKQFGGLRIRKCWRQS